MTGTSGPGGGGTGRGASRPDAATPDGARPGGAAADPAGVPAHPHGGVVPGMVGLQEVIEPEVVAPRGERDQPAFTRFCARVARGCLQLGVFGLTLLLAAVVWQVFGRYVLNSTPTWAESLALLLVLYVTMLGCAVGVRDAGHIGMELIEPLMPERWHRPFAMLVHVLTLVFGALMAWNCGVLLGSVASYRIPTLGISESFRYVPLVAAGVLIVLFSVEHLVALARGAEVEPAWH